MAYAANDYETAEMISQHLGTQTIIRRSQSVSRPIGLFGSNSGSASNSESEVARPLLLPQELLQLNPKKEIVLVEGYPPVKARKIRYHEDKRFKDRLYPPVAVPQVPIKERPPMPPAPAKSSVLDETELAAVLSALDAKPPKR